jgi:Ca2+-binding RTX toxin-like protein
MATFTGTADTDGIQGTADDDKIDTLGGGDIVFADAGNDTVFGGTGEDYIFGQAGDDRIDGGAESDVLDGGAGDDDLTGGGDMDFIGGGDGSDTAHGGWGDDTIGGGAGRDRLFGEAGADILNGEAGNDSLFGGSGDDNLLGGDGNDNLYAGAGQDRLSGGAGADNLYGSDGSDILTGGIGDDLHGEAGDDLLIWSTEQYVLGADGEGPDTVISGGTGYDTLRIDVDLLYYASFAGSDAPGPFTSNINFYHSIYGSGDTFIRLGDSTPEDVPGLDVSLDGIERVEASGLGSLNYYNNAYPGDPYSGPLNITVVGTVHDDSLSGGYGEEVLIGGGGQDTLSGGIDADVFVYAFRTGASATGGVDAFGTDGNDIVFDFSADERDVMRLDAATDLTAAEASGIGSDPGEILITQTAENAVLTFVGNGATIQFDSFGVNQIGAIGGDTLQALEAKLIGIAGDSSYDPFQFV